MLSALASSMSWDSSLAVLVDPRFASTTQLIVDDLRMAASKIDRQIEPFAAGSQSEIDFSFAKLTERHCGGLLITPMPRFLIFVSRY